MDPIVDCHCIHHFELGYFMRNWFCFIHGNFNTSLTVHGHTGIHFNSLQISNFRLRQSLLSLYKRLWAVQSFFMPCFSMLWFISSLGSAQMHSKRPTESGNTTQVYVFHHWEMHPLLYAAAIEKLNYDPWWQDTKPSVKYDKRNEKENGESSTFGDNDDFVFVTENVNLLSNVSFSFGNLVLRLQSVIWFVSFIVPSLWCPHCGYHLNLVAQTITRTMSCRAMKMIWTTRFE